MTLPRGTWLGELTLFEVYASHNGPRLFSAVDSLGKYYLAVATDEQDDHQQWLYVPVSNTRLANLRVGIVDLAEPFRRPEGGFAFHVTTFANAKKASTVEPIPFEKLTEEYLPRHGFKLKLAYVPTQWRVNAIRNAETRDTSVHETRVVRPDDTGLTAPIFVSRVIRRWGQFAAALVPKVDIRVASVAAGSLRAIYSVPKAKQKQVVEGYAALVACGTDITRLRRELRSPQVISAYFELVNLLAEEQCSLEVATARRSDDGLEVHELTRELAHAQAAGLAEPHEETEEREFLASVIAASLSSSTIELKLEDEETLSGTVVLGANKLTGLRIGGQYLFGIRQITRTDTPSAAPKIVIELHMADADFGQFEETAPQGAKPSVGHAKVLTWSKPLSSTDALHAPSGSIRAFVPLTGSRTGINYTTWFRRELFGDLTWSHTDTPSEELSAGRFQVKFMGVVIGSNTLNISHQPNRIRHNREAPTRLYWNASLRHLLTQNNVSGETLTLIRDKSGQLHLIIGKIT